MVSEHTGAQQPEFEIPGWAWGAIGTVIGFGLVYPMVALWALYI